MDRPAETSPSVEWKQIYLSALFESNKSRIPAKIAEAQRALAARRSDLLRHSVQVSGSSRESGEIQALDSALFALNALKNCLAISASAAA